MCGRPPPVGYWRWTLPQPSVAVDFLATVAATDALKEEGVPMDVPSTMSAIGIREPGGPDVLVSECRPVPSAKKGQVLIRVRAAGVNMPDVLQRKGRYPVPPGVTDIPGLEVAGTIVAMGEEAGSWKVGDAVCALAAGGGYAEYVVAYAGSCLPVPQRLSWIEAAALPETFFTVWENLYRRARLAEGETVLIHGGSSGIGTTAIQLARESGARVFVTVGTEEKRTACEKLGAERAINYREEDFVEIVKALTSEKGVDVILDMVGGDYVQRNIAALAVDGRLMNINYMTGIKVNVDFRPVLMKSLTLGASVLRSRSPEAKAVIASELRARVWPWLEFGRIAPVIYRTFSLAEASAAHALMESSQHVGKIVLVVHDAADASPH